MLLMISHSFEDHRCDTDRSEWHRSVVSRGRRFVGFVAGVGQRVPL